jgi:type II secretory pathway pseudopilin PulG
MTRDQEPLRDQRGITIVEVVITTALLSLVMAVLWSTLWQAQRTESYTRGRTEALDDMRLALNRMSKDLRQATDIVGTPTPSRIEVTTYVDETLEDVVYEVTGSRLTRTVAGGAKEIVRSDLVSSAVFEYEPDADTATIVKIELVVKPNNLPDTTLTLDSEVDLRNRQG